jgi:hypothetical protein
VAGDWLRAADPLFSRKSGLSERLIIAEFPSMERVWLNQEIGSIFARVLEMPLIGMETVSRIRAMSICRHESSE